MKQSTTHGGTRPGAGRPRLGEHPRVPITFSVDLETRRMAQEIRRNGGCPNSAVEQAIRSLHSSIFGED